MASVNIKTKIIVNGMKQWRHGINNILIGKSSYGMMKPLLSYLILILETFSVRQFIPRAMVWRVISRDYKVYFYMVEFMSMLTIIVCSQFNRFMNSSNYLVVQAIAGVLK